MDNPLLQQGIEAVRRGQTDQARILFVRLVKQEPENLWGWLWLAQMVDTTKQQLDCLRQAARIDSQHEAVRAVAQAIRNGQPLPDLLPYFEPEPEPEPEIPAFSGAPAWWAQQSAQDEEESPAAEPEPEPEPKVDYSAPAWWAQQTAQEEEESPAAAPEPEEAETPDFTAAPSWWTPQTSEVEEEETPAAEPEPEEAEAPDFAAAPSWWMQQSAQEEAEEEAPAAEPEPEEAEAPDFAAAPSWWTPQTLQEEETEAEAASEEPVAPDLSEGDAPAWWMAPSPTPAETAAPAAPTAQAGEMDWASQFLQQGPAATPAAPVPASMPPAPTMPVPEPAAAKPGLKPVAFGEKARTAPTPEPPPIKEEAPIFDFDIPAPASSLGAEPVGGVAPARSGGSLLQRASMARAQAQAAAAAAPSPTPTAASAGEKRKSPLGGLFRPRPAAETDEAAEETATAAPPRRGMRLFDPRVFIGLLELLTLPALAFLGWWVWQGGTGTPAILAPQALECGEMDTTTFTPISNFAAPLPLAASFGGSQAAITQTLVIPQGYRLLLEPGATLAFTRGASLEIYGELYTCGDAEEPVVFTAANPAPGGWEGLRFHNPITPSLLQQTRVEYGGMRALLSAGAPPLLNNVAVVRSLGFPLSVDASALPDLRHRVLFEENVVQGVEIRPATLQATAVTWPEQGFIYVVTGLIRIGADQTLEIAPGVVVKFWQRPRGQAPGLWVRGLLKADGVVFTSLYDSSEDAGGPTYAEAHDPRPGDWNGIVYHRSSAKNSLNDVVVRYAGQYQNAVVVHASAPEISDLTIESSAMYPLSLRETLTATLSNLTFRNNTPADAIEIQDGTILSGRQEYVWGPIGGETPIARVVRGTLTIAPETKLTLEAGTVIKFEPQGRLVVSGTLQALAKNDAAGRIVFTSIYDSEYGGASVPNAGPQDERGWGGIALVGVDATTDLENVIVRYAPLKLVEAAPKLYNIIIQYNTGAGIEMTPGAAPDLRAPNLDANGLRGIAIYTSTLTQDVRWARLGGVDDQVVRILLGQLTVGPRAALTLEPGTVVKAGPMGKLTVLGGIQATGNIDQIIRFTSMKDDQTSGDLDGVESAALPGDWLGLELGPTASAQFGNTSIYYAQYGLILRENAMPVFGEGWLEVSFNKNALWCTTRMAIPEKIFIQNNTVDTKRCPSQ